MSTASSSPSERQLLRLLSVACLQGGSSRADSSPLLLLGDHFQGPSEWYYAFVPILGPLIGGFLGAAAFYGCIQLNDYPPWFEGETGVFGGSW